MGETLAAVADARAIMIGWLITGIGMIAQAYVYQGLAVRKPALDSYPYTTRGASAGGPDCR